MQQLRRFLVPIILLFLAILVILVFTVAFLRSRTATGDAANGTGGFLTSLLPQAAGPVQPTAAPAAQAAAAPAVPAAAPQPAAAAPAPAAAQPAPLPTAIPAPTAVIVQQLTPVPAINTKGNVLSGNAVAGSNSGTSSNTGSGDSAEAGGVQCGTRVIHTVRADENLFRIGLRYKTTAAAIARLNRITNVRTVSVGRRLVVVACARGGGSGAYYSSRSGTYAVRAGDTLFSIASRFGVNVKYLCQVNGLYTSLIVPGQTLVIP